MFQRDSGSLNAVVRGTVRRIPSALTVIALAVVLTACGGGGGEDPVVPASISVTSGDESGTVGSVVRFWVQASGTDLTFQWQRSTDAGNTWGNIAGATSSALELANVTADQDGHQFRAHINGKSGSATSSAMTLHVTPVVVPPSFSVDLASPVEVSEDTNITLSVTAGGTNLTYLWQSSTNGGTTWTDIPGNNAPTLALQAVPLTANGTQYRVTISNSAASLPSKVATLKVNPVVSLPVVTTQPQAQSVTASSPATFTVAGTGKPTPTVQWQVSTNSAPYTDIPGATSLTYTIASTSTSLSGNRYRAVLTNSVGSVPSDGAALTVQVAPVPAKVETAPANRTAVVGEQVEFKVTTSGTPTPTIQWQISTDNGSTWSNINGATSATYTTPVLTAADNNKRYRAVASNSAGSDPSAAAVLTVNAVVSVLSNKSWRAGALIESDSLPVYDPRVGISDDGIATAIFTKSDGPNSYILYATDKKSDDSGWSEPIVIDTGARIHYSSSPILSMSPNGHVVAVWQSPGLNYSSSPRNFAARKMAGGSWESPILIGDLVFGGDPTATINDNGDIAILFGSDRSAGRYPSIAMRKSSESTYRIEHLTDSGMNLGSLRYIGAHIVAGLDKSGNITVVAQRGNASTGTNDIVAYRGTVSAGFGTTPVAESLESRAADASLQAVRVGLDGHVAVVWNQNNGSNNATLISVRSPTTGTWEPNDLTLAFGASLSDFYLAVPDGTSGEVIAYEKCFVVKRVNGVWKDKQALPNTCGITSIGAMDRNGNYVVWSGAQWAAYDASQNIMIKPFPAGTATTADYILGVNKDPRYSPNGGDKIAMALSPKGLGVSVVTTEYTQMPSTTGTTGDFGNIRNLWGFQFK